MASEISASEKKKSASEKVLLTKFLGDGWDHVTANYEFLRSGE